MNVSILKDIKNSKNKSSHRQARVSSLIKTALAEIIIKYEVDLGLNDGKFISISNVKVSPDLHNATIYVTIFPDSFSKEIVDRLNKFSSKFRKFLSQEMDLKFAPQIVFRYDDTLENVGKINNLLQKIDKE